MGAANSSAGLLEARLPETIEVAGDAAGLEDRLGAVPDGAGVFLVRLREGAPYLGRTALLRRRLRRLLREPGELSRRLNLRGLASHVEYWLVGSRLESSLLLYELARRHFPETYVSYLKLRFPPYVKAILSNPFPRTQVTTRLSGARAFHYGPFRNRAAAEQFDKEVLDLFQVRRCPENLEPSPDHPGCIYGEMSLCLRPCQAAVSRHEYASEVSRLVEFLASRGRSLLEVIAAARDRLSEEMNFEEAARQHQRLEKVQQVLRLRDELAEDSSRLCGVAVTASAVAGAAELWFFCQGGWQPPLRVSFEVADGKPVPLDRRLREMVAGLQPRAPRGGERQEHLALLARWYYSSWRDGEWLRLEALDRLPYRKLVAAVARAVTASLPSPSRPSTPPGAA
jgi:hypothetical protein